MAFSSANPPPAYRRLRRLSLCRRSTERPLRANRTQRKWWSHRGIRSSDNRTETFEVCRIVKQQHGSCNCNCKEASHPALVEVPMICRLGSLAATRSCTPRAGQGCQCYRLRTVLSGVGRRTTRSVAVPFPEAEPIWTAIVGRPRRSVAVAAGSSVSVKLVTPVLITVLKLYAERQRHPWHRR